MELLTPQQEAARILLQRRNARRSLADWARLNGFEPAAHHRLVIDRLERVVRGELNKVAFFLPPGSAKSTYTSILFPSWYLAQSPDKGILTASHSADMAMFFGRRARNLIQERENVLGYALRTDSQAADEWATDNGGYFFCAGVGGRIAGRRADLGLIDDPVGSKEDAYSKVIRDKTWEWYKYDFITRLKPGASIVLIQTRWHEDDLAGRLLATEGDEWTVVNLPLLAKANDPLGRAPGELLWPEYFTEKTVAEAKKDKSKFSALYQQDPTPEDGDFFRAHWIEDNAYDKDECPALDELVIYSASDHAVSERDGADPTCTITVGVDHRGVIWILDDILWEQMEPLALVNAMVARMRRYQHRTWISEADKIGKSIGPFLRQHMREAKVFCHIEEIRPARDKQTRAQSIRGRLQAGMVRFPRYATWYDRAKAEMLKFPAGAHDDFVDALAYIGLYLDNMAKGEQSVLPVDPAFYFKDKPLTMKWLKNNDRRAVIQREAALRDN